MPDQLIFNDLDTPYNNRLLFSDHFLSEILPTQAEWEGQGDDARLCLQELRALYAERGSVLDALSETQLERDFIQPVLAALGHTFEIQPHLRTPAGTKRPDYVFYRNRAARDEQAGEVLTEDNLAAGAFAVGDAKAWDRSLDAAIRDEDAVDGFSNRNPSSQIAFYIQHSGLEWGLLTNGRLWRLYHRASAYKLDRYYEINLPALLVEGDVNRFLYFFVFFRRLAFNPGPLSLRSILDESAAYASAVGDSLKQQVFSALLEVAQGFLDYAGNGLSIDPVTVKAIYDNSLVLLYRLLFILYAEARGLLPLKESQVYREQYSFDSLKRRVAVDLDRGQTMLPTSARLWVELAELFRNVDQGNPALSVPAYNGGLFDNVHHPFLADNLVGDARLQQAINLLSRVGRDFVDYRDLAERHLGTIYEGLLEHHLVEIEETDAGFKLDLLNEEGERSSSGSYYTPDYVVKYMVSSALDPLLEEAAAQSELVSEQVEAVLRLNVLDPAMGSGHFLVEATEHIAQYVVGLAAVPAEEATETDVAYWRRRVAQSCIYGVDVNPLAVELAKVALWLATAAKEKPLSFLDHHFRTGNSLVGASFESIRTASQRASSPQRRGKKKKSQEDSPDQHSLLGEDQLQAVLISAVGAMMEIENASGETVDSVRHQEEVYSRLRTALNRRYGRLADLVTAGQFSFRTTPQRAAELTKYLLAESFIGLPDSLASAWQTINKLATQLSFFHWELEFPEVFFTQRGQRQPDAGFDAIVGNPPYVSILKIPPEIRAFILANYATATGRFDLYIAFNELALRLLRRGGSYTLIQPIKYLVYAYGRLLRDNLLTETAIDKIVDLSQAQVFADPTTYASILLTRKGAPPENHAFRSIRVPYDRPELLLDPLTHEVLLLPQDRFLKTPDRVIALRLDDRLHEVVQACTSISTPLGDLFDIEQLIRIGSEAARQRLVLSSAERERAPLAVRAACRKLIDGKDVEQFGILWADEWLNYVPRELYNAKSPEVLERAKVLIKRIAPVLTVAVDLGEDDGFYYPLNTVYGLLPKDGTRVGLHFVESLLNSTFLDRYYKLLFEAVAIRGGYLEFREPLQHLPIRNVDFGGSVSVRERFAERVATALDRGIIEGDFTAAEHLIVGAIGTSTRRPLSAKAHDAVATVGQRISGIQRQRAQLVRSFLLDVEGALDAASLAQVRRLWTAPTRRSRMRSDATERLGVARDVLNDLFDQQIVLSDAISLLSGDQWRWLLRDRLGAIPNLALLTEMHGRYRENASLYLAQANTMKNIIDRLVPRLYGVEPADVARM